MPDPVIEAALNAWASWLATEPDARGSETGVRVAVEVARCLVEVPLQAEIKELQRQLAEERDQHRFTTERLYDSLKSQFLSSEFS